MAMADDTDAAILYALKHLQDAALSDPFFAAGDIAERSNLPRWEVATRITRLAVDGYLQTDALAASTPLYRLAPRGRARLDRTHRVRDRRSPSERLLDSEPQVQDSVATMREHVLVVDDDPILRHLISEVLTQEDYEVETASDGREALTALERNPPAVMLLDMQMPVLDGWTVAQRLHERHRRVPTVVMTGVEDAAECCATIDADAYLGKPFVLDQLLFAVVQALKG
jgi:CheY-like chemotaxis protein